MFNFMRLPPLRRLMLMKAITGGGSWSTVVGNPVSFTAKAAPLRRLSVAFSPVQDLRGYDSPWPAGGGVNKFDKTAVSTGYINDATGELKTQQSSKSSDYIPVSAGASYRIVTEQTIGMWGAWYDENKTYISGFTQYLDNPVKTAPTGAHYVRMTVVYSGNGNADTFAFNNPSTVTTYSPYSNECPISGWDSLNVEQYGGNLADPNALVAGYINNSGEIAGQSQTQLEYSSDFIPMPPNTQRITVGYNGYESGEAAWMGVALYDENKGFIQRIANVTSTWKYTANVAGRNAAYFRFTARTFGHGLDKMFCGIGDVSEFTPFTGHRSISITLGETIYSGTVDVVTGQGEITWAANNMGTLNWVLQSAGIFRGSIGRAYGVGKFNMMFSSYKTYTGAHSTGTNIERLVAENGDGAYINSGSATFFVADSRFDNLASFESAVTGQTLVYELATPIPISLTPQEVESLAGGNVMWSDANGDLTVEYRSN